MRTPSSTATTLTQHSSRTTAIHTRDSTADRPSDSQLIQSKCTLSRSAPRLHPQDHSFHPTRDPRPTHTHRRSSSQLAKGTHTRHCQHSGTLLLVRIIAPHSQLPRPAHTHIHLTLTSRYPSRRLVSFHASLAFIWSTSALEEHSDTFIIHEHPARA